MEKYKYLLIILLNGLCVDSMASISHGPMLGDLSAYGASIWFRTSKPEEIEIKLVNQRTQETKYYEVSTSELNDNTHIVRFDDLDQDTTYEYEIKKGTQSSIREFKTRKLNPHSEDTKIVFGSCYNQGNLKAEGGRIFKSMLGMEPDAVIFAGDLPYSKAGRLNELRENHKIMRSNQHFMRLTATVPTYAIYDDHDYGTDNSDGTYEYKEEALKVFNEYWPNPPNITRGSKGIYTSFVLNNIEVFLLDTRYFSRQEEQDPVILGEKQMSWLCSGLKKSSSKYKVIVTGVSLSSTNNDGWNGEYYTKSKSALFSCINDNSISGVIALSGDSHRSEIHKYRIGGWFSNNYLYEFTSSPLKSDVISKNWPNDDALLYSYKQEDSLYSELVFSADAHPEQVSFAIVSPERGEIERLTLNSKDLSFNTEIRLIRNTELLLVIGILLMISLSLLGYVRFRKRN